MINKIGFAGLGHLGLNSIVAAAMKGFNVVGYENDYQKISNLNKGNILIKEPGFKKNFLKFKKRILLTSNVKNLSSCKVVYVSLDVNTDKFGNSNLKSIIKIINEITKFLDKNAALIILSQVPPGFTRKIKWNKKNLFYQVETLIFGNAINRALKPERLIIGCSDSKNLINKNLKFFLRKFNCPILSMKYESAEFAKIAINTYLSASVTTSNTLAELCEKLGADWSEIIPTLKMDRRIGNYAYLRPGLGISGGNLERDLNNVIKFSKKHKTSNALIKGMILNSHYNKNWVWKKLNQLLLKKKKNPKISLLGLSYKENTSSIKNAPSIYLIKKLKNFSLSVFDPWVPNSAIKRYSVSIAKNSLDAIKKTDALVILSPWKEFSFLKIGLLKKIMSGNIIIDPYRVLNQKNALKHGFIYSTIGNSPEIK